MFIFKTCLENEFLFTHVDIGSKKIEVKRKESINNGDSETSFHFKQRVFLVFVKNLTLCI